MRKILPLALAGLIGAGGLAATASAAPVAVPTPPRLTSHTAVIPADWHDAHHRAERERIARERARLRAEHAREEAWRRHHHVQHHAPYEHHDAIYRH